jgi:hypothetical protein
VRSGFEVRGSGFGFIGREVEPESGKAAEHTCEESGGWRGDPHNFQPFHHEREAEAIR